MGLSLSNGQRVTLEQRRDARRLRAASTPAEDLFWQAVRGKKLGGLKFRRQQPVMGFVVDFYCESKNLAVELDGGVHNDPAVAARDAARELALRAAGLRFLRFKNRQVETDLPSILKAVLELPDDPAPSPRRRGGGAPH